MSQPPSITPADEKLLRQYADAVLSAPVSLTAADSPEIFWNEHISDALEMLPHLPSPKKTMKVIDIGSGNGIPGIVFAICRCDFDIVLVESNSKKYSFLESFLNAIGLKNVSVIKERAEIVGRGQLREGFDIAIGRALAKLPSALELLSPFVCAGGTVIVPHGTSYESELARSSKAIKALSLETPKVIRYGGGERVLLQFAKRNTLSDEFPRRVGIPTKRPL